MLEKIGSQLEGPDSERYVSWLKTTMEGQHISLEDAFKQMANVISNSDYTPAAHDKAILELLKAMEILKSKNQ